MLEMKPDPRQHIFERDDFTCQYCGAGGSSNLIAVDAKY